MLGDARNWLQEARGRAWRGFPKRRVLERQDYWTQRAHGHGTPEAYLEQMRGAKMTRWDPGAVSKGTSHSYALTCDHAFSQISACIVGVLADIERFGECWRPISVGGRVPGFPVLDSGFPFPGSGLVSVGGWVPGFPVLGARVPGSVRLVGLPGSQYLVACIRAYIHTYTCIYV